MEPKPKPTVTRLLITTTAIVSVFALAGVGSVRVQRETAAKVEDNTPTIAVLPFVSVGPKGAQNFSDGMSEEIASKLASLRGLRVVGRLSASDYAGSTKTPQQIASELGVNYLLVGTVRWDNSQDGNVLVRVSPRLLSDHASQIWADAYQTILPGMFEVQAKVATRVASALNISLLTPEREALNKRPTDNLEAYDLYMRAVHLLENPIAPGPIAEAITSLERATALDDQFTLAWCTLSIAHTEYFQTRGDQTAHRLDLARAALGRAASINPASPDVHLARGILLYHGDRDYSGALRELAIAEKARPNDYTVQSHKGAVARRQGRWADAIDSQKRSFQLEPRNGIIAIEIGNTLRLTGDYKNAEMFADRGILLNPESSRGPRIKSNLAIDIRGNIPEAVEYLRNAVGTVKPPSDVTALLQDMTWPAVEDPSLRQMLIDARQLPEIPPANFHVNKARLYLYLKNRPRARAYADSAARVLSRISQDAPDAANEYVLLAVAQAVRGERNASMLSFNRSEQLLPAQKDAFTAGDRANQLPTIYLLLGDYEATISALENRIGVIGGLSRNRVRLDPMFAPLRGNPRFERLIQPS
jgi:TolB-like protein/tetratricopeptide (TPR) repeat protein